MSKQYDLSEILNLVEKREELTLKLIDSYREAHSYNK